MIPWRSRIYFVAVATPTLHVSLDAADLYAVSLDAMCAHITYGGVGTVSATMLPALALNAGLDHHGVLPLEELLRAYVEDSMEEPRTPRPLAGADAPGTGDGLQRWGFRVGGHFPSPLALSLPS